eukprot:GEMP01030857.1.p1 GENE.GEMP01030857.1~~GEMP01030857.1.p1  ORF type:complete len:616 (+),score=105.94 GEMP01030857.1:189-2036(+)
MIGNFMEDQNLTGVAENKYSCCNVIQWAKFILATLQEIKREFVDTFQWTNIQSAGYPICRAGDINAFLALFAENLGTVLVLVSLLIKSVTATAMPQLANEIQDFPFARMLPGLGISLLFGNGYFFLQASKVAAKTGNMDTCALPYGISMVGALPQVFVIAFAVYRGELMTGVQAMAALDKAWKVATACNFVSGIFKIILAFIGPVLVKPIHSAVLLTPIAGMGLAWLVFGLIKEIFAEHPYIGFLPFAIAWYGTFSNGKLSYMPVILFALLIGILTALITGVTSTSYDPGFYGGSVGFCFEYMGDVKDYIALLVTFALTNALWTLGCIRSAAESGDVYSEPETMIVDGFGSLLGAFFGSPFGTTVYIGHVAYRKLGAGRGYSLLNGIVYFVFGIFGLHGIGGSPPLAAYGIIVCIGLAIAKQTIELTPPSWIPAILVGFVPPFASILAKRFQFADKHEALGMNLLGNGYLFTSLFWTLALVALTERKMLIAAGIWTICALCAAFGIMHAEEIDVMDSTGTVGNICDGERSEMMCRGALVCTWKGDHVTGSCGLLNEGMPGYKLVVAYGAAAVFCVIAALLQSSECIDGPVKKPATDGGEEGKGVKVVVAALADER